MPLNQAVPIKFGTDGWRAVMEKEYTFENVERVAQGVALFVLENLPKNGAKPRVAVGYDWRNRSEDFAETVARILLANGIEPLLSDRAVPTPAVSRAVVDNKLNLGVGITASHNPGEYNGFKIKASDGSSAEPAITRRVEELIDKQPVRKDTKADLLPYKKDILTPFLAGIRRYADIPSFKKPFRILVDSMHGVGGHHLADLLKETVVEVTTVRGNRDIHFGGIAPEPILKNLEVSAELMRKGGFDLCVATDGDADRIGAIRPGGAFVSPGTLLSLIMLQLKEDLKKTGSVVTTVSNTSLIFRVAHKLGLRVHETPVGFKYICEIMRKEEVLIAGEESGGLAFHKYMLERDGILSALLLVQMMEYRGKSFEDILRGVEKEFGKFHYVRCDMKYPDAQKSRLLAALKEITPGTLEGLTLLGKKTDDGIKFLLEGDAWLLFRLSGTEPLLRIYGESTDLAKAEALVDWGKALASGIR
jgi:phosphomannomutase